MENEGKYCVDCHFICDKQPGGGGRPDKFNWKPIVDSQREDIKRIKEGWKPTGYFACYFGVYDTTLPGADKKLIVKELFDRNRDGECFWREYIRGMSFEAAEILQEREQRNKEAEEDRGLLRRELKNSAERTRFIGLAALSTATALIFSVVERSGINYWYGWSFLIVFLLFGAGWLAQRTWKSET